MTNAGRFSISVLTIIITASTIAGIKLGRSSRTVLSTCENRFVIVLSSVGRSFATAFRSALAAVGSAAIIFSITGVIFSITLFTASIALLQSLSISAFASPKPTSKF